MKTEVISFYCDLEGSTYYSQAAQRLAQDCSRLGIPHDIRQIPASEDWRLNCLKKPKYILEQIEEKGKPLLWLDCDSELIQSPSIVDHAYRADLGFCHMQAVPVEDPDQRPLPMASPIFVNNTPKAKAFLAEWCLACEKETVDGDHNPLLRTFRRTQTKPTIWAMPHSFCALPGWDDAVIMYGMAPEFNTKRSVYERLGMTEVLKIQKSIKQLQGPTRK